MGSRGAFIDVDRDDFNFVENGKCYETIGEIDKVKIIIKPEGSVKAPEYSHSQSRIYAVIQKGELKHLAFYNENHKQIKCIDFGHHHGLNKVKPHVHFDLIHDNNELGTPPSKSDWELINKIKKGLGID